MSTEDKQALHIAINAWFWSRPDTGSGQYTRQLVAGLSTMDDGPDIVLIAPVGENVVPPPGVQVKYIPLTGRGHTSKVQFEQIGFPRAAGHLNVDLAHIPYWGGPLHSPVPIVVTIHDLIPLVLPEYRGGALARLYTSLVAASARGTAAAITDSKASRRDILVHLHLDPSHVHVIPLAAAPDFHLRQGGSLDKGIRQKYDLPEQYVLYLGGYDVRKNLPTLLKAYTYVRDGAGDSFPLVLAGRLPDVITPRFTDVHLLIKQMNLSDVVRLIGWVDEADKPALYRMASCFVFPSYYEGFGLPVLEALACGTPVVSAEATSLPEIVGDDGFLVAPDDARHMAGAILATLVQEDLAANLRERASNRARLFSWARTARETLSVYQAVLRQ